MTMFVIEIKNPKQARVYDSRSLLTQVKFKEKDEL